MRLSTRIVLAMLCLIVLTGTAVGASAYFRLRQALVPSELARMALHARQIAQGVESDVRGALGNVMALSYTRPLQGYIRARSSGGTDPETGVAESEWKMRLNAIFLAHIQAEPTYSRIRIIGTADDGKELLRVERDHQTGEVRTVPENELQVKGYRNFFLDTLAVQPGKVHLSRLDLNQDYGAILVPHLPTLRASTPVLAPDGSVFGIVIINVDMRPTLDRIRASAPPYGRIMLLDEEGNYLVHPDPAQEFGFDLGKPRRITDDWQELRQAAWPASSLREIMTGPGSQHEALVLESFRLGGVLPLYVAKSVPYDVVMAPALTVRDSTIMTILVATLLAMLLSIFLARTLTRPIERMARALLKSTDSEDGVVPGGELEQLNKAFQTMRTQVMETAEALALKTEEQSETSRALSDSLGRRSASARRSSPRATPSSPRAPMARSMAGTPPRSSSSALPRRRPWAATFGTYSPWRKAARSRN